MLVEDAADFLGSASWIGADAYEPGGEFHERATTFLAAVEWDVLTLIPSGLRHGIPCKFGENFSIGRFDMLRRVVLTDGISRVARVRLPKLKAVSGDGKVLDVASTLKVGIVEIGSMKFLK